MLVCVQVVGLYRLCGSAAVKKELREAFERDSHAVELCENTYPDINVITGKLNMPVTQQHSAGTATQCDQELVNVCQLPLVCKDPWCEDVPL